MGKKKEAETTEIAERLEIVPVPIMEATEAAPVDILNLLPEHLRGKAEVYDSSLPPSPVWEKPGHYLQGEYVGARTDIGPNRSYIYEFLTTVKGARQKLVAVWGSTIMDQQMARARVLPGDQVVIVYRGEQETGRKLNPVKLFDVIVIRRKEAV